MTTTIIAVLVAAALLIVGSFRRRRATLLTDVALYGIAVITVALAAAVSLPAWARVGYVVLGLLVAAVAARDTRRRHASAASIGD
jgi:hypothetical protein